MADSGDLDWKRDGQTWPNHEASSFVEAAGMRWHVQRAGTGPTLLLLHGTGAATHSWRDLLPRLAENFDVVAPDLPGHGFTGKPPRAALSLPGMARATTELLRVLGATPTLVVGHSAGVAVLARMCLDGAIAPDRIIGINAALRPFRGLATQFFSPLAKLLALNPAVPRLFVWGAGSRSSVERLIRDTGSKLDEAGIALYERVLRSPRHVAGALGMMANWDLFELERDLPSLRTPMTLIAAGNDRSVSPDDAFVIRDQVAQVDVRYVRGLGHLAHEEAPQAIADLILELAKAQDVSFANNAG